MCLTQTTCVIFWPAGDLAYADSNASRWDSFQRLFDLQGCADIPWLVLPGNHDGLDISDVVLRLCAIFCLENVEDG